jgi:hypothetical protein
MWRASDVIDAADLADAVDEVERGQAPEILTRLGLTEPHLARFLEKAAATCPARRWIRSRAWKMRWPACSIVVRALERGHGRLWRHILPPLRRKE